MLKKILIGLFNIEVLKKIKVTARPQYAKH